MIKNFNDFNKINENIDNKKESKKWILDNFKIDIDILINDIADSYEWDSDDRWDSEIENEHEWFDMYEYFAKNDLISNIQDELKYFIDKSKKEGKINISLSQDEIYELSEKIYENEY